MALFQNVAILSPLHLNTQEPLFVPSVFQLAHKASMRNQRGDAAAEPAPASTGRGASAAGGSLQAVSQMPPMQSQPPALCRALYDFNPEESNLEDSKYGLSFVKV